MPALLLVLTHRPCIDTPYDKIVFPLLMVCQDYCHADESQPDIDVIRSAIELLRRHIDWDKALQRQSDLEAHVRGQIFGRIRQKQKIMREKNHLDQQIDAIRMLENGLSEHTELMELAEEENDAD